MAREGSTLPTDLAEVDLSDLVSSPTNGDKPAPAKSEQATPTAPPPEIPIADLSDLVTATAPAAPVEPRQIPVAGVEYLQEPPAEAPPKPKMVPFQPLPEERRLPGPVREVIRQATGPEAAAEVAAVSPKASDVFLPPTPEGYTPGSPLFDPLHSRIADVVIRGVAAAGRTSAIGKLNDVLARSMGFEPEKEIPIDPTSTAQRTLAAAGAFGLDYPLYQVGGTLATQAFERAFGGAIAKRIAEKALSGEWQFEYAGRALGPEEAARFAPGMVQAYFRQDPTMRTAFSTLSAGGAFGLADTVNAALREVEAVQTGQKERFDPAEVLKATGKGVVLGAAVGLTGAGAAHAFAASDRAAAEWLRQQVSPVFVERLANLGALGTLTPIIHEGRLPTLGDLVDAGMPLALLWATQAILSGQVPRIYTRRTASGAEERVMDVPRALAGESAEPSAPPAAPGVSPERPPEAPKGGELVPVPISSEVEAATRRLLAAPPGAIQTPGAAAPAQSEVSPAEVLKTPPGGLGDLVAGPKALPPSEEETAADRDRAKQALIADIRANPTKPREADTREIATRFFGGDLETAGLFVDVARAEAEVPAAEVAQGAVPPEAKAEAQPPAVKPSEADYLKDLDAIFGAVPAEVPPTPAKPTLSLDKPTQVLKFIQEQGGIRMPAAQMQATGIPPQAWTQTGGLTPEEMAAKISAVSGTPVTQTALFQSLKGLREARGRGASAGAETRLQNAQAAHDQEHLQQIQEDIRQALREHFKEFPEEDAHPAVFEVPALRQQFGDPGTVARLYFGGDEQALRQEVKQAKQEAKTPTVREQAAPYGGVKADALAAAVKKGLDAGLMPSRIYQDLTKRGVPKDVAVAAIRQHAPEFGKTREEATRETAPQAPPVPTAPAAPGPAAPAKAAPPAATPKPTPARRGRPGAPAGVSGPVPTAEAERPGPVPGPGARPGVGPHGGRVAGHGAERPPLPPRVVAHRPSPAVKPGRALPARLLPSLSDEQQTGAALMIQAMDQHGGGLLADGTGVGKTREILTIAEHYSKQGFPVLIVAPAEVLKIKGGKVQGSYAEDGKTLGVDFSVYPVDGSSVPRGTIVLTTYHGMQRIPQDKDLIVVFDEAHQLKNSEKDSRRGRVGVKLARSAKAALFSTATPADQPTQLYYLDRAGIFEGKSADNQMIDLGMIRKTIPARDRWGRRYSKQIWAVPPDGADEVIKRVEALFDRLTEQGRMVRREVSMEGVPVEFRPVDLPPEALETMNRIESGMTAGAGMEGIQGLLKARILMHQRRQQEPYKVPHAVQIARDAVTEGRQAVLFVSRVNYSEAALKTKIRDRFGNVVDEVKEVLAASEGTAKTLADELTKAGLKVIELHGEADAKAEDVMRDFRDGKADVLVATIESGGLGLNLDDRTGTRPRTLVVVTAPFDAVMAVQSAGRVWRKPTMSFPEIVYLHSLLPVDLWNMEIIADKLDLLGAAVQGEIKRLKPTKPGEPTAREPAAPYKGADLEVVAERIFGTTDDWRKAGYILGDGTMLDFSGRNQGSGGGKRNLDHRDIWQVYEQAGPAMPGVEESGPESTSGNTRMRDFMDRTGAIRWSPEAFGAEAAGPVTVRQAQLLAGIARSENRPLILELVEPGTGYTAVRGGRKAVTELERPTTTAIQRFFETAEPKTVQESRIPYGPEKPGKEIEFWTPENAKNPMGRVAIRPSLEDALAYAASQGAIRAKDQAGRVWRRIENEWLPLPGRMPPQESIPGTGGRTLPPTPQRPTKPQKEPGPLFEKPEPEQPELPTRTAATMGEAITLGAPTAGRMSGAGRKRALERLRQELFGPTGLPRPSARQPTEAEALLRQAQELRDLAARGMRPRAYLKKAEELEDRALTLQKPIAPEAERLPAVQEPLGIYSGHPFWIDPQGTVTDLDWSSSNHEIEMARALGIRPSEAVQRGFIRGNRSDDSLMYEFNPAASDVTRRVVRHARRTWNGQPIYLQLPNGQGVKVDQPRDIPDAVERLRIRAAPETPAKLEITTPEGEKRAVAGFDQRLFDVLGQNLYSGRLPQTVLREALQNAKDSIEALPDPSKGEVSMTVDSYERSIVVRDNGIGMTPEVATKEMVDIGGSVKPGTATATGGFGIAKVGMFYAASAIHVTTFGKVGDRLVRTDLEGSGQDWIDPTKGLRVTTQDVPADLPTGTVVSLRYPKETAFDAYDIRSFLKNVVSTHRLPFKVAAYVDGDEVPADVGTIGQKLADLEAPGATIEVFQGGPEKETNTIVSSVMSNGLPQFADEFWMVNTTKLPERIVLDVHPTTKAEDPNYPFTTDRSQLKDAVKNVVSRYITDNLVRDALSRDREQIRDAIRKAPKIRGTRYRVLDTEQSLPQEFLNRLADQPFLTKIMRAMGPVFRDMQVALARYDTKYADLEFWGVGLGRDYLAVNVPGSILEGTGRPKPEGGYQNFALVNLLSLAAKVERDVDTLAQPPTPLPPFPTLTMAERIDLLGRHLASDIVHELTHQIRRAHEAGYAAILTDNMARVAEQIPRLGRRLSKILTEADYDALNGYAGELAEHYKERSAPDLFGKAGVSLGEPAGPEGLHPIPAPGGPAAGARPEGVVPGERVEPPGVVAPGPALPGGRPDLTASPGGLFPEAVRNAIRRLRSVRPQTTKGGQSTTFISQPVRVAPFVTPKEQAAALQRLEGTYPAFDWETVREGLPKGLIARPSFLKRLAQAADENGNFLGPKRLEKALGRVPEPMGQYRRNPDENDRLLRFREAQLRLDLGQPTLIDSLKSGRETFVRGEVLGLAFDPAAELLRKGRASLVGKQLDRDPENAARQLARLTQIVRDPRVEIFTVWAVKDGKIVGYNAFSSGLPGVAKAVPTPHNNWEDWVADLNGWINKLGADSLYLQHNHPSGVARPSKEDVLLSFDHQKDVPTYKGHIIIDSGEWAFIPPMAAGGVFQTKDMVHKADFGEERLLIPAISHPLLGAAINEPKQLNEIGRQVSRGQDQLTLFYMDSQQMVRGIQNIAYAEFLGPDFPRNLAKQKVAFGAAQVLAVARSVGDVSTVPQAVLNAGHRYTNREPILLDFYDQRGLAERPSTDPLQDPYFKEQFGRGTFQVREPGAEYQGDADRDLETVGRHYLTVYPERGRWLAAMRQALPRPDLAERLPALWDRLQQAVPAPAGVGGGAPPKEPPPRPAPPGAAEPERPGIAQGATPKSRKPGAEITPPLPDLTDAILKEDLHQDVVNAAGDLFLAAGVERNPDQLISDQILELIQNGRLTIENMEPVLAKHGLTFSTFGTKMFRPAITDAARRLQRLSALEQAINRLNANLTQEGIQKLRDALMGVTEIDDDFRFLNTWRRLDNIRRGLLVTQWATAIRNFETQVGRVGLDVVDLALQNVLAKSFGGRRVDPYEPLEALGLTFAQFPPWQKDLRAKLFKDIEATAAFFPKQFDRLTGYYYADILTHARQSGVDMGRLDGPLAKAESAVYLLNWLNRFQERIVRNGVYLSTLEGEFSRAGKDLIRFITDIRGGQRLGEALAAQGIRLRWYEAKVKHAVQKALEMTFAEQPEFGSRGWHFVKWVNSLPFLATGPIPFPRFLVQTLKFYTHFNPLGWLSIMTNRAEREAFRQGDWSRVSRAVLGATLFGAALMIRMLQDDDKRWYEVEVPKLGVVDTRAYNPFAAYFIVAELAKRLYKGTLWQSVDARDIITALLSVNVKGGQGLWLLDQVMNGLRDTFRGSELTGPDKAVLAIKQFFGALTTGPIVTALRTYTDFMAQFIQEMAVVRNTRGEPFVGPLKELVGQGEPLYRPTAEGPVERVAPALRQMTGLSLRQEKNPAEKELDRLQFDRREIMGPPTGDPTADNLIAKYLGPIVEERVSRVVESAGYAALSDGQKMLRLRDVLAPAHREARLQAQAEEPELFQKLKAERKPWRLRFFKKEQE